MLVTLPIYYFSILKIVIVFIFRFIFCFLVKIFVLNSLIKNSAMYIESTYFIWNTPEYIVQQCMLLGGDKRCIKATCVDYRGHSSVELLPGTCVFNMKVFTVA